MSLSVGMLSGFIQNIGAAALFLPGVLNISRRGKIPAAALIMPIGFAAILGGTLSMVGSGPLILINAPTGWITKRWDSDKLAALADRLIRTYNAHVIYTGAAGDTSYINAIIALMKYPALNAAGNTTLKELACLISRARLFVTTDSGPMHLAVAVGTPVVALFGPTAPWRTGPYTERARIVRTQAPCSPCYKRTCDSMICMNEIGVDQVMEAAAVFMVTEGAPGT